MLDSEGTKIFGLEFLLPILELDVMRIEHNLITLLELMRAAETCICIRLMPILNSLEETFNPGQGGGHVLEDIIQIGKVPFWEAQ